MSKRGKSSDTRFKAIVDMMYGFGDVGKPLEESIQIVEDLAILYMRDLATRAANLNPRRDTIRTGDVLFVVRKDKKKFWRGQEVFATWKEHQKITEATTVSAAAAAAKYKE